MDKLKEKYQTNTKLYYMYSAFTNLLIIGPILTMFLIHKGLDFTQIMTLQALSGLGVVFLEVPTGALADLVGRKLSIILGSSCMAISLLIYVVGQNFIVFAIAELIFSLGMSFKSGADTALLYDSCKALGEEDKYKKYQGKAYAIALVAQIPGSILAGYLYEINISLPMLISCVFMMTTIIITMFFKETPAYHSEEKPSYLSQIKDSAVYIKNHNKVKAIIIFTMFFYIFLRCSYWFYQPYFNAVGIEIKYFGYIFALFNLVAALGSRSSHFFVEKTKGRSLIALCVLLGVSYAIVSVVKYPIGVLFMLIQQGVRGIYRPTIMKYINKNIPSQKRATIISVQSLLQNLTVAILFPLIGILMDHVTIFSVHMIMAIVMGVGSLILNVYLKNRLSNNTR